MAAFDTDEDRDLPSRLRSTHVGGGSGEEQLVRMPIDEGVDHLDVLERAGEGGTRPLCVRCIDPRAHELRRHSRFYETWEIGVAFRRLEAWRMPDVGIVAIVEDPGGHVVVRVDHERVAVHTERARRDFGDAHRARWSGRGDARCARTGGHREGDGDRSEPIHGRKVVRGKDAGVGETYGSSRTKKRRGHSPACVIPILGVTTTSLSGTASPRRMTTEPLRSDVPLMAPTIPIARHSFPGPLVRSRSRFTLGRRRRINSMPSTGETARMSTALPWPRSRVTALKHQY